MEDEYDYLRDDYVDWDECEAVRDGEHTNEFWNLFDNEFFEG